MKRILQLVLVLGAVGAAACGKSSTPLAPSTPVLTTDTFTGTLAPLAGLPGTTNPFPFHIFSVAAAGPVNIALVSAAPPATITIGLGVGSPSTDGSTCSVTSGFAAATGTQVSGAVSAAGSLCLAVFDVGNLSSTNVDYTVTVSHP